MTATPLTLAAQLHRIKAHQHAPKLPVTRGVDVIVTDVLMFESDPCTPFVGQPATVNMFSDSRAAVVTKVNKKSILVAPVSINHNTERRINDECEPFPVIAWDGLLDKVIGEPQRYPMVSEGNYRNGSVSITLGKSVSVTDYRV